MDDLFIELDFSKVNSPALGMGISTLKRGLHTATVTEFKHFPSENGGKERLYMHMETDGLRHRDSFGLDPANLPFLAGAITSAGIAPSQYAGKKVKFPFHKVINRTVYFFYTPPQLDENGNAVKGSWPKYNYFTKEMYTEEQKRATAIPAAGTDFEAAPEAAPAPTAVVAAAPAAATVVAAPAAVAAKPAKSADDFGFLADD